MGAMHIVWAVVPLPLRVPDKNAGPAVENVALQELLTASLPHLIEFLFLIILSTCIFIL